LHSKKYGERTDISETERAFMVTYLCSFVVVLGGLFIGLIW
jgi:hypothetical protein